MESKNLRTSGPLRLCGDSLLPSGVRTSGPLCLCGDCFYLLDVCTPVHSPPTHRRARLPTAKYVRTPPHTLAAHLPHPPIFRTHCCARPHTTAHICTVLPCTSARRCPCPHAAACAYSTRPSPKCTRAGRPHSAAHTCTPSRTPGHCRARCARTTPCTASVTFASREQLGDGTEDERSSVGR